ncbi:MAG: hypothetical protein ABIL09_15140 [Gemmatimonadota bacterium]
MRTVSRTVCFALATLWLIGCGEKKDELGPYIERLKTTEPYWNSLLQYREYLKSPETESKARDVRQVIEQFKAAMDAFPEYDDKYITAGHNSVRRDLERALKQITEPDFPTFTVSALKQINLIEESMVVLVNNMEKRWRESRKTEPYPIKWPGAQ